MATTTKSVPQHSNPHISAILTFAASGKAGKEQLTPNGWVQGAVAAKFLPASAKDTSSGLGKAIGRTLRGHIGRATGNGVGRGRTYPALSATELLALSGYTVRAQEAKDDKVRNTALAKANSTWDRAHKRRSGREEAPAKAKPAKAAKAKPEPKVEAPAAEQAPQEGVAAS